MALQKRRQLDRYIAHARELGEDIDGILRHAGTSVGELEASAFVSPEQFDAVVASLAEVASPTFALSFGASRRLHDMGVVGHAMLSCGTMTEVVDIWVNFAELTGLPFGYKAYTKGDKWFLELEPRRILRPGIMRFCVEEAVASFFPMAREVREAPPVDLFVEFAHPPPAHHARYAEFLPGGYRFGGEKSRVIAPATALDSPMRPGDPEVLFLCQQHCGAILKDMKRFGPTSARVREILLSCKGSIPSVEAAARIFGMTKRTLNRRLAGEGRTYPQLVEEFRRDYAIELLRDGAVGTKQIAHTLGFRSAMSFRRAFQAWTGQPITEWRRQNGNLS